MIRFRPAAVVLLVTALTAPVLAQDGDKSPPPAPLIVTITWCIEDEILQKDLKLTPAQLKDVLAARQKSWDFYYRFTPKEVGAGAADADKVLTAALKKILSPEQVTRAEQLAAQINWGDPSWAGSEGPSPYPLVRPDVLDLTRVNGVALHYSPELAAALKLTDEQKKLVTDGSGLNSEDGAFVYLTPDQTAAAKAFLGPIVKHNWTLISDPRTTDLYTNYGPYGTVPGPLGLTAARDVRAAINMTDDQVKELAPVREVGARSQREELSPEKRVQRRKEQAADADKALARVLKPDQLTRLKQIDFQLSARTQVWPDAVPFSHPVAEKVLGVTAEQKKAYDATHKAYAEAVGRAVKAGSGSEATDKAIKVATAERSKAVAAILTPEQAKKLADLTGAPFTGNTTSDQARQMGGFNPGDFGGAGNPWGSPRVFRELSFGRYALELSQLSRNESIQSELKLTPEQIKKAATAYQDQLQKFPLGALNSFTDVAKGTKLHEERSKFVEKALGEVLTADQAKRFRQIMIQERERPLSSASRPVPSAVSYPGVAEAVKLTAEQKKKLFEGTTPAEVLTDEQKAAIKPLLGEPFKGTFTTTKGKKDSGFGGPPWGPPGAAVEITPELRVVRELTFGRYTLELSQLSRNESIQSDLKLTPEQIKKAATAYQDQLQKFPARDLNLARSDPEKAAKLYEERSKFVEKALADVLTADQAKRFRQIMIQVREQSASTGGSDPTTVPSAAGYPGGADALKLTAEQKKKLIDGTAPASVLTAEQRTAVRDMRGEPFKGLVAVAPAPGGTPGTGFGTPGGGMGGPGGGTRVQDPEQSWTFLQRLTDSTGDTADLGKIPPQTHAWLKSVAERTGGIALPESGTMTKAAYLEYFYKSETARAEASGQLVAGNPALAREWTFGRYTSELSHLTRNEAIRTELKLTPEQVKKVGAAYQEVLQKFLVRDLNAAASDAGKAKWFEERSKFVEKALGEVLTADQAKRFRQIMIQERERPLSSASRPVPSAVSYPGVADAVKLTAEQKKKLIDGTTPADVLTEEQKAAIKPLLGDPFKGTLALVTPSAPPGGGWSGPGGFIGSPRPSAKLTVRARLVMALPWEAVNLTSEQVGKLVPAITRFQAAAQGPNPQKIDEAAAALNKEVEAILTPDQIKRLDQLIIQGRAAGSLFAVLTDPGAPLKLTPEQSKQLADANRELSGITGLVGRAKLSDEKASELWLELRDQFDARIQTVLTAEQKAAWKELTGAPYAGFQRQGLHGALGTTPAFEPGRP